MILLAMCCPWVVIAVSRIKRRETDKFPLLDALFFGGIFAVSILFSLTGGGV